MYRIGFCLSGPSFGFLLSLIAFQGCVRKDAGQQMMASGKVYVIDDTTYELPYRIPGENDIADVLERVCARIEDSTPYRIIQKNTGKEITDFSVPDSNAVVDTRMGSFNLWEYTVGVIHAGMFATGEVLGVQKYLDYPIRNYDFIFDHLPYFREVAARYGVVNGQFHRIINMHALDHCGSIGAALVQACSYKVDPEYLSMIGTVEQYIMKEQFRLEDGTLARQRPQEASVWADDMYMCIPFLARMGTFTGQGFYYEEAVRQVLQISERLFSEEDLLFDHGWNKCAGDFDPRVYWARGNGWAMMAMATLLEELPASFPGREFVLMLFRKHVQGIAEHQGGNGLWHNVLDRTDSYSETSSSAMFIYSIAKGVNSGWIDHTYGSVALAGWNGMLPYIGEDGRIENMCAGTTFSSDLVYYYHRPASHTAMHGYGPVLLAGSEMIRLLKNPDLEVMKQYRTFHFRPAPSAETGSK